MKFSSTNRNPERIKRGASIMYQLYYKPIWSGCRDSDPESRAPKARMLTIAPHPEKPH